MLTEREAIVAEHEALLHAWEHYGTRLTQEEARAIAAGDYSAIVRPFEPQWVVGTFLAVARSLEIKVRSVHEDPRGLWLTRFDVRDFRAKVPRRTPSIYDAPELDELGYPIEPTREAIERARITGNYTAAQALAVVGCEDEPDETFMQRDRLKREVDMRDVFKRGAARRRADLIRYERQLIKARERGRESTVRILETKIRRLRSTLAKAA